MMQTLSKGILSAAFFMLSMQTFAQDRRPTVPPTTPNNGNTPVSLSTPPKPGPKAFKDIITDKA
ncbi:MAG: hypothetical protein RLZZ316_2830, partial [Bacteroidota bacterium]